mgnify:CR=1 FL=1
MSEQAKWCECPVYVNVTMPDGVVFRYVHEAYVADVDEVCGPDALSPDVVERVAPQALRATQFYRDLEWIIQHREEVEIGNHVDCLMREAPVIWAAVQQVGEVAAPSEAVREAVNLLKASKLVNEFRDWSGSEVVELIAALDTVLAALQRPDLMPALEWLLDNGPDGLFGDNCPPGCADYERDVSCSDLAPGFDECTCVHGNQHECVTRGKWVRAALAAVGADPPGPSAEQQYDETARPIEDIIAEAAETVPEEEWETLRPDAEKWRLLRSHLSACAWGHLVIETFPELRDLDALVRVIAHQEAICTEVADAGKEQT